MSGTGVKNQPPRTPNAQKHLDRDFVALEPNTKWANDFTYVRVAENGCTSVEESICTLRWFYIPIALVSLRVPAIYERSEHNLRHERG